MPGPQLTGKHLLSGLCCGPDMSGPYRVTMANGSCGGVKTPPYGAIDTWVVMARLRAGHARPLRGI